MMKEMDYFLKIDEINKKCNYEMNKLHKKFALSNNPYKQGDIIQDHCQIIEIKEISITKSILSKVPYCIYKGLKLKKNLEPFKSHENASIHQINIEKNKE